MDLLVFLPCYCCFSLARLAVAAQFDVDGHSDLALTLDVIVNTQCSLLTRGWFLYRGTDLFAEEVADFLQSQSTEK